MESVGRLQSAVGWEVSQECISSEDRKNELSGVRLGAVLVGLLAVVAGDVQVWGNEAQESCVGGLAVGAMASLVAKSPLPLLGGMAGCWPGVSAQQMVGGEFQVNTYTNSSQKSSSTASFINNNFVVAWASRYQDGSGYGVYGQLFYENVTRIGNEFQVNTYTTGDQYRPSVASFYNGNFVVAWQSRNQDGSEWGVYGQLFDGNAARIGNEFQINSYTAGSQQFPLSACLRNGNFVVTWSGRDQDGSDYGVYGQLFDGNGYRQGSEFQVNTYTTNGQYLSSVASFSNSDFVVVWQSYGQDGSDYGVYGQLLYVNGTKLGSEFQVNTHIFNAQVVPRLAAFNNGRFVVAWNSWLQDGSGHGIYGQLFYGNGTKLGNEFQINTHTDNHQETPSVMDFRHGGFVVTWNSNLQDGSEWGVYGQLFDGNANRIGNEFQVNTFTDNPQINSATASFSNGNFVVTWSGRDQDGSNHGVYGQFFEGPLITSSTTSITSEIMTRFSSSILNSTTNPPPSSTDATIISSSSNLSMISSASTISSVAITTSRPSDFSLTSTEPTYSSGLKSTAIPSTGNPEITNSESIDSNIRLIIGLLVAVGVGIGCGLVASTYIYLKKRREENREEINLGYLEKSDTGSSSGEDIQYANIPQDSKGHQYANIPEKSVGDQYANVPEGAGEAQYANIPDVQKDK